MFCVLGQRHLNALDDVLEYREGLRQEFLIDRRWTERRCNIYAPYGAWVQARDLVAERCFTPRGTKQREQRPGLTGLLKQITTATNTIERHPALRKLGMLGHQTQVLHVWELPEPDDRGRFYSLAPVEVIDGFYSGRTKFVVLHPVFHDGVGSRVTTWGEHGLAPTGDRLADEAVHLPYFGLSER